jgi:hypothetical protein
MPGRRNSAASRSIGNLGDGGLNMGTHCSSALRALVALTLALGLTGAHAHGKKQDHGRDQAVRFATFNASLNRGSAGQLVGDLSGTTNDQARAVAEIVQRIDPDVLLINEFDYEDRRLAADLFRANYLEQPQHADVDPIRFLAHVGNPAYDTADFADGAPGNLRADYVLPSKDLRIKGSGVFWPLSTEPEFGLVGVFPFPSSDHRAVWLDVRVPGTARRGRW